MGYLPCMQCMATNGKLQVYHPYAFNFSVGCEVSGIPKEYLNTWNERDDEQL